MTPTSKFNAFQLQDEPSIVVAAIPGKWLLQRSTPTWRIDNPERGFQRMVSEQRARSIALAVLEERRSFPNAIVLATDLKDLKIERCQAEIPKRTKFLVVDGQHRLFAQQYSEYDAPYCCVIHLGMTEQEMARLFVEINDNQKRVPSSLRWDLVRLVRDDITDPHGVRASDLVYSLAMEDERSPLFQRVDLTGENKSIALKQGSVAPELKKLVSAKKSPLQDVGFDVQYETILSYVSAIRDLDRDRWKSGESDLYKARVFRALLMLLPQIIEGLLEEYDGTADLTDLRSGDFHSYLELIDLRSLDPEVIKSKQGSAGIKDIYLMLEKQIFR